MAIYFFFVFILSGFSVFEKLVSNLKQNIFNLVMLLIALFLGLRYNVGNDYEAYWSNYLLINKGTDYALDSVSANEPLYILANQILSFEFFVFLFAFLSIWFLQKAITFFAEPNSYFLVFLVYFCLYLIIYNVHLIRQGLAISIVLYSYIYLYNKKYKMYLLLVIIAFCIHTSAIVVAPFGFLFAKNIKIKLQLILLSIALFVGVNSEMFISVFYSVARNVPILSSYLDIYRQGEFGDYGISTGIIMDICLVLFLMANLNKLSATERFLYNIFFISVILSLVLLINPGALRFNYYFRSINIFLLPLIYRFFKIKIIPIIIIIGISLLYLISSFQTIGPYGRGDRNLPYKTIFNKR